MFSSACSLALASNSLKFLALICLAREVVSAGPVIRGRVPFIGLVRMAPSPIVMNISGDALTMWKLPPSMYAAQPLGLAMIQSGMVGQKDKKSLTRMIRAATLGAFKATLDEVEKIQKESQSDGPGN